MIDKIIPTQSHRRSFSYTLRLTNHLDTNSKPHDSMRHAFQSITSSVPTSPRRHAQFCTRITNPTYLSNAIQKPLQRNTTSHTLNQKQYFFPPLTQSSHPPTKPFSPITPNIHNQTPLSQLSQNNHKPQTTTKNIIQPTSKQLQPLLQSSQTHQEPSPPKTQTTPKITSMYHNTMSISIKTKKKKSPKLLDPKNSSPDKPHPNPPPISYKKNHNLLPIPAHPPNKFLNLPYPLSPIPPPISPLPPIQSSQPPPAPFS